MVPIFDTKLIRKPDSGFWHEVHVLPMSKRKHMASKAYIQVWNGYSKHTFLTCAKYDENAQKTGFQIRILCSGLFYVQGKAYSFKTLHSNLKLINKISRNYKCTYLVKKCSKMMKIMKIMEWLKFDQSESGNFLGSGGHQKQYLN